MRLSDLPASKFVKLGYIGDSGTGKSGSLVSLVKAGYNLKILDFDNGLPVLREYVLRECPDNIDLVDAITIRDQITPGNQGAVVTPRAYIEGLKYMTKWDDGSIPAQFGENGVVVIDTLTTVGKSAYEWAKGQAPGAKDPRQWYFAAQQSVENFVAMLMAEQFHANVIVIAHVNYKELADGSTKGYMTSIGSALGPVLPRYFNTLIQAETIGQGRAAIRQIRTISSPMVDLKTPAPFRVKDTYPLGTGLAELFATLKHEEENKS